MANTPIAMNKLRKTLRLFTEGKSKRFIASQLPVVNWHQIIAEKTVADAVMDRVVHNAHRLELKGESMRRKRRKTEPEND